MAFGEVLRELRGSKSQDKIAREIGLTKSAWAMYERNERIPRDEVKIRIASYFGKTVQEIFLSISSTNGALRKEKVWMFRSTSAYRLESDLKLSSTENTYLRLKWRLH